MATQKLSDSVKDLQQNGIRSASVRCAELDGINLGQGICDIPTEDRVKQVAKQAIDDNHNMYAPNRGLASLRRAIADKLKHFNQIEADPEREILVSHGATGAYVAAVKTLFNPGDDVILFEPYYGYHQGILKLLDINVKSVPMDITNFSFDIEAVKAAISAKTKGIIICTPNNPSGKVFTKAELLALGTIAEQHDLYVLTDEIYEYVTYPGHQHVSFASLSNHWHRTVTISGFSKTYHVTGWRLGYASGPKAIIEKMTYVHDLLYICPPVPLQYGALEALSLPQSYYDDLKNQLLAKRDFMVGALRDMGFQLQSPQGAYYLIADFSQLPFVDDQDAVNKMLNEAKVAMVTGRSFYQDPADGKHIVRICYAMQDEKLQQALRQLNTYFKRKMI